MDWAISDWGIVIGRRAHNEPVELFGHWLVK